MARYLSGRTKRKPQSQLKEDRYRYLSVDQAEPNLGDPTEFDVEANLPPGNQYQIVSVIGSPGERYWIPRGGGLIPGAITVFDEDVIIPNNSGVSSITQLNFKGDAIRVEGYLNLDGSPGVGVTITVFSPGSQGQFIINDNNEFTGVSSIFYDVSTNYIGIGTDIPSQILDVNGDIKLRGTIYDWDNQPGIQGDLIVKNNDGGFNWSNPNSVVTGAGGQIGQIQFHANTGLVDGADIFYYDDLNDRVGIGSTQPSYLLDVLGISSFKGTTYIDNLSVTNLATLNKLTANGETIFKSSVDAEIGANLNDVRIGISGNNEIDTSAGNLILDSNSGKVIVDDDLVVSGITSVGFITARDAYISGILTAINLDFVNTLIQYITVTGIATINTGIISQLNVTGIGTTKDFDVSDYLDVAGSANFQQQVNISNLSVSGIATLGNIKLSGNTITANAGNLVLDSNGGNIVSQELIRFDNTTESTNSDNGSVVISGGLGVKKNLNVSGNINLQGTTNLASNGGITTTGGDLYIGGDLYVKDDIVYDEFVANRGEVKQYLKTKDFEATGISTISTLLVSNNSTISGNLTVSGTSTFNGNVDLGNATSDTVTFISRVDSDIIPSTNNTRNLGSSALKWNQVYATEFVGAITGNADTATKLQTARNIEITGDLSWNVNFDGSSNVTSVGTLVNTGVVASTYGSSTTIPVFNVDSKGRITSVTNTGINFSTATVAQSDTVRTTQNISNSNFYLTFVDSNNSIAAYESLHTDSEITYNPSTNLLTTGNLTVSGTSTFNGNVNLGNATTDLVTFTSRINSDILPSTNNTRDLGSNALKWNQVYATEFVGQFIGNATSADKLSTARIFRITGDVDSPEVSFDGTGNVNLVTTLDNTGVTAGTYGSSTTVPVFNVDSKGRLTSVTNTGINFSTATVAQSDAIRTVSRATDATHYLTFVDSNNSIAAYESLHTDGSITYNPSSNSLGVSNLGVFGDAIFNGNVDLGNATSDTVTFISRIDSDIIPSTNNTRNLGSSALKWNTVYATTFNGQFIGNADTATTATHLAGGAAGSIPYQTASNTTTFLAEPNVTGRVLTYNNTTNAPQWSDLTNLPGAGYTLESVDSGNNVILRLSDGSTNDDVTITAGSNITINPVSASGFTISAASLGDLGGISGIEIRDSGTTKGTNVTKLDFINDISATVSGDTATISVSIPTTTSDLTNDSGFITSADVPTDVSELTDTTGAIPTTTSDLTNDSGFITSADVGDGILTLSAGTGVTLSAGPTFSANQSTNKTITISADSNALGIITVTTTSINKTLSNLEFCTVLSDGLSLTLPSSPSVGSKVIIGMGTVGTNITIIRNGSNIMGLAENFTIDIPYATVTFTYINSSLGWTFS